MESHVIPAWCKGVVIAQPLPLEWKMALYNGAEAESSIDGTYPSESWMLRGVTRISQNGPPLAHCKQVTLVTQPNAEQTQDTRHHPIVTRCDCGRQAKLEQQKDPRGRGTNHEVRRCLATNSSDYEWTDRVYHHTEAGESWQFQQSPRSPLYWNRQKWARCTKTYNDVGLSVVHKVAPGQVFLKYFGFPCQFSFHWLLLLLLIIIIIYHTGLIQ
jgi:hypothetical protein